MSIHQEMHLFCPHSFANSEKIRQIILDNSKNEEDILGKATHLQYACVTACACLSGNVNLNPQTQKLYSFLSCQDWKQCVKNHGKLLTGVSIAKQSIQPVQTERAWVWQLYFCVYVRAHSKTQMESTFVIDIDSVHCQSSEKLSGGIIILTVTNTLHTHTYTHTHTMTSQNIHGQNHINSFQHSFFTVKLTSDKFLPVE